jgi:uncharacterized protein YyaL (SSP411 family)
MTSAEGGFYSAEDADSERAEGKFYLWSTVEIAGVLGPKESGWFRRLFNLRPEGNFEDPTGSFKSPLTAATCSRKMEKRPPMSVRNLFANCQPPV